MKRIATEERRRCAPFFPTSRLPLRNRPSFFGQISHGFREGWVAMLSCSQHPPHSQPSEEPLRVGPPALLGAGWIEDLRGLPNLRVIARRPHCQPDACPASGRGPFPSPLLSSSTGHREKIPLSVATTTMAQRAFALIRIPNHGRDNESKSYTRQDEARLSSMLPNDMLSIRPDDPVLKRFSQGPRIGVVPPTPYPLYCSKRPPTEVAFFFGNKVFRFFVT
jgi:hypothetical protein